MISVDGFIILYFYITKEKKKKMYKDTVNDNVYT